MPDTDLRITIDGKAETLEFLFDAIYPGNPNNPKAIKILADSFQAETDRLLHEVIAKAEATKMSNGRGGIEMAVPVAVLNTYLRGGNHDDSK